MSFVQRLSKIQRKSSEGNQKSKILENEPQMINLKNTRKLTEFEKNHSDLKSMLQYLQCQKSTKMNSTSSKDKAEDKTKQPINKNKIDSIDTKQNSDNRIHFKNSPDKRLKLKINKLQDESDIFEIEKDSFLIRNLQYNKKTIKQNPENNSDKIKQKTIVVTNKFNMKQKKGIPNIGNTCYINAVLQCLFHMKDFNQGLVPISISSEKSQILQKYLNLFDSVMRKDSESKDLSTLSLKRSVSKICSLFIDFHQEDAHQFLKQLFQSIHQQINRIKSRQAYRVLQANTNKKNLSVLSQEYWSYYKKFDDSLIYDSLCGQICSYVTCINCKFQSVNFDNFLDFSLPMVKGKNKLEDLIKQYFDREILSDYYFCSSCKKSSKRCLKRSQLWRNPNYLIIQLKRSQFGRKNNQNIHIPVRCLNLKPYFTSVEKQSRSTMYHLQGIVLHRGVIQGGHYWAYVKDGLNWYSIDDQKVQKLKQEQFVRQLQQQGNSQAYILFYKCV